MVWMALIASNCPVSTGIADDLKAFEGILLDAQKANSSKIFGGTMKYKFTVVNQGSAPLVLDANVRWDQNNAFWTYKISDPDQIVAGSTGHKMPVDAAPNEYKLKVKNQLYSYNAQSGQLHLNPFQYPDRLDSTYFMFDVFPESLGTRCCIPNHSTGRSWSDLVGSKYAGLFPNAKITMSRIPGDVLRQTRTDQSGATGIIDFSLAHSGLPVLIQWTDPNDANQNSLITFVWKKVGNVFVVEHYKSLQGDFRKKESDARKMIEFQADSITLSKSKMTMDFDGLKAILPKNTIFVDNIRQRRTPLHGKFDASISEIKLNEYAEELEKKGFAAP